MDIGAEGLSRRFQLRARTTEIHAALDHLVGEFNDVESYRVYLRGICRFRLGAERHFGDADHALRPYGYSMSPIGDALRADLHDLGVLAGPPVAIDFPLEGVSAWLGFSYVIEGSSIGARLLVKRAGALGLGETYGARHLARQAGSQTWPTFVRMLDEADIPNFETVVEAATATFHAAERAFSSLDDAALSDR